MLSMSERVDKGRRSLTLSYSTPSIITSGAAEFFRHCATEAHIPAFRRRGGELRVMINTRHWHLESLHRA